MKLHELFDNPLPWEPKEDLPDYSSSTFDVEDVGHYQVEFSDIGDEDEDMWEVEFMVDGSNAKSRMGIIGTRGKQVQIFSTVKDIIDDFLLRRGREIKQLVFSAKEPSRAKLYSRLAKLFGTVEEKVVDEDGERFTQFTVNV